MKIIGQIEESSKKDKLSFVSLARQIEGALQKGYKRLEIVDAVVRSFWQFSLARLGCIFLALLTTVLILVYNIFMRQQVNDLTWVHSLFNLKYSKYNTCLWLQIYSHSISFQSLLKGSYLETAVKECPFIHDKNQSN